MRRYIFICLLGSLLMLRCTSQNQATAKPAPPARLTKTVDSIVVLKSQRQMHVYAHGKLLKTYRVCLGSQPVGPKHFQNDGKTPEGLYHVDGKNPGSHYHKALGVSYPSDADRRYARQHGKPTGGDIKIHGLPNNYQGAPDDEVTADWTAGCIALNSAEIDELYTHVNVGAWVRILP